jgi:hypothetical protein
MDKKIIYYAIGGLLLILAVWGIVAINSQKKETKTPLSITPPVVQKSETEVNRDIAQKLELAEGQLPLRVTRDDNRQTASLTPGKNITLMLGEEYAWTISSNNDKVLAPRNVDIDDARVQGVYQVVGEGSAVLAARGDCKSGAVCETPSADFTFTVEGIISENFSPEELTR